MATLKQSTTYTRMFLLVQTADHLSGLTGATPTVTLSKAGGSFASAGGTVTEVSSGWYKIALTTTDTNTLGDLAFHVTAASGDPTDFVDQVTANILGDTLSVNATQINGVSTSSVTTINANVGTTQPTNFTGTGGSALVKSDMVDIAGAAVSTSAAQIGVNAVNIGGTAQTGRDIGASVLLSSGTGTGQLSLSSGTVTVGTNNDKTGYTASTVSDKTGYSLAANQHVIVDSGTVTTVTNQLTAAQIATGVWTDTTAGDFTTALSIGKSIMNGVSLGTGLTVNDITTKTGYALTSAYDAAKTAAQAGDAMTVSGDLSSTMKTSVENAVWNATMSSHTTSLTTGASLNAAGAAGDPWSTAIPGSYGAGTAGNIVGNNLDAAVSTRSTFAGGAVASVTAGVTLTSAYDAAKTAAQAGDAMALTSNERNSTADAFLNRDMSTGSDSGSTTVRTVRQALRFLRNKWAISAGTLTVYKEDDSTSSWTSVVSTDGAAEPIVGTDPAGP